MLLSSELQPQTLSRLATRLAKNFVPGLFVLLDADKTDTGEAASWRPNHFDVTNGFSPGKKFGDFVFLIYDIGLQVSTTTDDCVAFNAFYAEKL